MKKLRTEISINASREKVWSILTDFDQYPKWNPFIRSIKGNIVEGEKIQVHLAPPQTKGMVLQPKILKLKKNTEFSWLGHLYVPGVFDGEHIFKLIESENGTTKFVQKENFSGILIPFFKKMLGVNTKNGFEAMNKRLKELCESK